MSYSRFRKLKVFFVLLLLNLAVCHAEYISAPIQNADWQLKKGPSSCQLIHNIPYYGVADFMHRSGELLRFSIREKRFKPQIIKASLALSSAPWIHQVVNSGDFVVNLDRTIDIQDYPRLSVYGYTAEMMLDALYQGMFPTFSYVRAEANGFSGQTHVAVSAVRFRNKYRRFNRCRKNFLPSDLKTQLQKSLFFKPRSTALNPLVLKQLKNAARYIKEVKSSKVQIISDTAIAGNRDKKWFSTRAKVIAKQLKAFGVAKNRVSIKAGMQSPVTDGKTIQLRVFGPDALNAIYYRKGNIKLTSTEKKRLDLLLQYAKKFLPQMHLVISSHTDSKGRKARNLAISRKRGEEIKRYLVSKGMNENNISVKAYGESRPAKSNRFPRGRAQNRRAIIRFVS